MLRIFTRYVLKLAQWLVSKQRTKPDPRAEVRGLSAIVESLRRRIESNQGRDWLPENLERAAELVEARSMVAAPWLVSEARGAIGDRSVTGSELPRRLREADPIASQGATGDINLMLQTVNWKREINLSWLEFSRWGIQQLILISRLYWMKNPIVRRLVDVCAAYVFARGVEVTTGDEGANAVLKDFFERNKQVLGRVALVKAERQKDTDGNIFWAFFRDGTDKGLTTIRTIDALEVMDIITDPEDQDTPWFYLRVWSERSFDQTQQASMASRMAWYPALGYKPDEGARLERIREIPVIWDVPIYHRKCGDIGKWLFGCPRIYPMLDWAKESNRFLTACAAIRQALAQFSMTVTTKGGAQALDAIKQQIMTTVGPNSNLLDSNPPAIPGSIFGSGPGTKLEAFKTQGAGFDPEGVRQYKLMCCMVKGVPETFLADVSTGNLATATTLDRPTETFMLSLQEEWVFDLTVMCKEVLEASDRAPSGALRESLSGRGYEAGSVSIRECERVPKPAGGWRYAKQTKLAEAVSGATDQRGEIKIQVNFPAIREGDVKVLVDATVEAGTLGNKGGQVVGIDEKTMMKSLYRILDIEDGDELAELQYPEGEYDPDRTTEDLPAPIPKLQDQPGGAPPPTPQQVGQEQETKEALNRAAKRVLSALRAERLKEASRGVTSGPVL
jgi:hypothetical protein